MRYLDNFSSLKISDYKSMYYVGDADTSTHTLK